MLQVQHLRKDYGATTILADISFVINDGEHIGLVGANGAGKSTLLRCITGQESPDSGSIIRTPADITIGYLPQAFDEQLHSSIGAVVDAAQAEFVAAEAVVQRASDALATTEDMTAAMAAYDAALTHFEALGGYAREHRAAAVLQGLGLRELDPARAVATLSGGQKTRLGLATLLLREPDLLLLDEPTNHLDMEALEWLEEFVQGYPRAALIVSHDREFLDRTVTRIFALDPETRTLTSYTGNYSAFAAARTHEQELHAETWKRRQETAGRIERDIARLKGQAQHNEKIRATADPDSKFALDQRSSAKKVARQASARERKLERLRESDEWVERPPRASALRLDFGPPPPGGRAVLRLEAVSFGYPDHPPLLQDVTFDVQYGERLALVGPNGAGKTTLLRLMAGHLRPTAGQVRLGANIRPGLLAQEQETLDPQRTILETVLHAHPMSTTEARNFLHRFLFGGDSVFQQVGACSYGERGRLQLALLMLGGCNLLLLDEPLNHLDIAGREQFEAALEAFAGTVIAVAHDRAFLQAFAQRMLAVRAGGVRPWIER